MTPYMKWGLTTRLVALFGFLLAMASQWFEPIASTEYANLLLLAGFALAILGVASGLGLTFRKTAKRAMRDYHKRRRHELKQ